MLLFFRSTSNYVNQVVKNAIALYASSLLVRNSGLISLIRNSMNIVTPY